MLQYKNNTIKTFPAREARAIEAQARETKVREARAREAMFSFWLVV